MRDIAVAAGLLWPFTAVAHPHSWIDMKTAVVLGEPGKVSAIRQHWLFDEYYTSSITRQKGSGSAALEAFAQDALVNLKPYDFFTHLKAGTVEALTASAIKPAASLQGKRLSLEFELPLQTPVDVRERKLLLSVYDPTYYIDMLYGKPESITFSGPGAEGCRASIVPAQPSEETKRRALSMDRQATPDHSLGEKFAERVEISCRN